MMSAVCFALFSLTGSLSGASMTHAATEHHRLDTGLAHVYLLKGPKSFWVNGSIPDHDDHVGGPLFLKHRSVNMPVRCPAVPGTATAQARWVTLADPRLTPLKYLIQPAQLPPRFCLITQTQPAYQRKWRVDFEIEGLPLVFEIAEALQGGNARGQTWQLRVPLQAKHHLLLAQYPFLGCKQWQSHRYCAWHFSTAETQTHWVISGSNQAQPCQPFASWADIFAALSQEFRACSATRPE